MTKYKHISDSIKESDDKQFVSKHERDVWNSLPNNIDNFKNETDNKFKEIKDIIGITVSVVSENGVIFKNEQGSTTLHAKVLQGTKDITDTIDESLFKWKRTSSNPEKDKEWNAAHTAGTKSIIVDAEDIKDKAKFSVTTL